MKRITLLFLLSGICFHVSQAVEQKKVQHAHLAGSWYPADKSKLTKEIETYFLIAQKKFPVQKNSNTSALIVPHAGYKYSGLCAATAYQAICSEPFDRVIILGPSHQTQVNGIALPNYKEYKTVLGTIPVDTDAVQMLSPKNSLFKTNEHIWQTEHSIEIQLPFLQSCLKDFQIVPLAVGKLSESDINSAAIALSKLLDDNKKTLIIISSDFIHYGRRFGYTPGIKKAKKIDQQAVSAILNLSYTDFENLMKEYKPTICGANAIKILLKLLEQNALGHATCKLVNFYDSQQITGEKSEDSFVTYAGIVCTTTFSREEESVLLKLARQAIRKKLFPEKKLSLDWFAPTKNMEQPLGVFVTLKTKNGRLRGCIGRVTTSEPLYKTVQAMAQSAAFHDTRFSPLKKGELQNISISITILMTPKPVASYNDIVIGKHGIILEKNGRSALYLPQVAPEQGWNIKQTLESLSQKAGLPKDGWKDANFKVFEGFEFGEHKEV